MNELESLRSKINSIDEEIIKHLSERLSIAREIGAVKHKLSLPIGDLAREEELIKFHEKLAGDYGLDEDFIQRLFAHIINESKKQQVF